MTLYDFIDKHMDFTVFLILGILWVIVKVVEIIHNKDE